MFNESEKNLGHYWTYNSIIQQQTDSAIVFTGDNFCLSEFYEVNCSNKSTESSVFQEDLKEIYVSKLARYRVFGKCRYIINGQFMQ